ncbi:MAG: DUF86 domain-containing protein, partial [Anaerolineae bacterium]|nr:DUF86 domain-containing protein [Anaerolineae bacterium]
TKTRLAHMLEAARLVEQFLTNVDQEAFFTDTKTAYAVVRALEIMGEAASGIDPEMRVRYPEIPWRIIIDMRNRLIHGYFSIDYQIVWDTAMQDLPAVIRSLSQIIKSMNQTDLEEESTNDD